MNIALQLSPRQVQAALLGLLDRGTVLAGHSLENDLRALRMAHGRVLDTALVYGSSRGPTYKPALRHLAQEHLGQTIQASTDGHSSVEVDSRLNAFSRYLCRLLQFTHFEVSTGTHLGIYLPGSYLSTLSTSARHFWFCEVHA